MLFSKKNISDLVSNSQRMFDIAQKDPVISAALEEYNYDSGKIDDLKVIWGAADAAVKSFNTAVNRQSEKSAAF